MLPKLAAALHTTVDALLGYDIMKILPPVKPYRLLDIGCGEGKDAVFFAKCGYAVTAFDISEQGIEKAKRLVTA